MKMPTHLRIQQVLGLVVVGLTLIVHFGVRVAPGLGGALSRISASSRHAVRRCDPSCLLVLWLRADRQKSYANFLKNSSGLNIDTTGIEYGTGHPVNTK
jgi:hypothetical protein